MDLPINEVAPLIMHIDLNSCFAIIEQQANPLLRYKPVAVAAYDNPTGIVLAASYEAKVLGVKLGVKVKEARSMCPNIIILTPDPSKYREAHRRLRQVLLKYTSDVMPRSIDEFVIDFKGSAALREGKSLVETGYEIKEAIKLSLGNYVTVNIGIGPNRFLAKLAAGLNKPDGLDTIQADNLLKTYSNLKLIDLPGINRQYRARLLASGIVDPTAFLRSSADYLKNNVFHGVMGYQWYQRLRGWEVDARQWQRKSIGHQYALEHKTSNSAQLDPLIMKLSEKVGRRLRSYNKSAKGIHLSLRFVDHLWWHQGKMLNNRLYATQDIYLAARQLLKLASITDKVSLISITVYNLQPINPEQLELLNKAWLTKRSLVIATDMINDKFGEFTVAPAIMANMSKTIIDRVAFGNTLDT